MEPVLQLLNQIWPHVPYIHRDASTRDQLFFYIKKWTQRQYDSHPILYLGYHGDEHGIYLDDWRKRASLVSLDDLEDSLFNACSRRVLLLASCGTLNANGNRINRFLRRTSALAICGYRNEVDPIYAAAFEVVVLNAFQERSLTPRGVQAIEVLIKKNAGQLARQLGFRLSIKRP